MITLRVVQQLVLFMSRNTFYDSFLFLMWNEYILGQLLISSQTLSGFQDSRRHSEHNKPMLAILTFSIGSQDNSHIHVVQPSAQKDGSVMRSDQIARGFVQYGPENLTDF